MLNRMFSIFYTPESHPLIPSPLIDVVIDQPEEDEITVSRPLPIFELSKPGIYDEINACLDILEASKKYFLTCRVAEEKRRNLLFAFNIFSLIASPGITFTVMYAWHTRLLDLAKPVLTAFNIKLDNAVKARDDFLNEYPSVFDRCNYDRIDNDASFRWNCLKENHQWDIPWTPRLPNYDGRDHTFLNYCGINPAYVNPTALCLAEWNHLCEEHTEFLTCYQSAYTTSNSLNKQISDWQAAINDTIASTWNQTSISAFWVTTAASSVLLTYLFFSWRNAQKEYLNDLNLQHDLLDCVTDTANLTRLVNLSRRLDICLENITLEKLVHEFGNHQRRLSAQRESRIEFLKVAHRFGLFLDASDKILKEADMLPCFLHPQLR